MTIEQVKTAAICAIEKLLHALCFIAALLVAVCIAYEQFGGWLIAMMPFLLIAVMSLSLAFDDNN